ncbi:hypothetical protein PIB30_007225 [Stylosanthes scabra]|uniref:Uncharacterized protein n=1 Tax=Stylosanthes scabra TaxID=79078 RepID=A0ABU6V2V0_9FABA|nr:hypothetical protein [Stylosanthes scabra]
MDPVADIIQQEKEGVRRSSGFVLQCTTTSNTSKLSRVDQNLSLQQIENAGENLKQQLQYLVCEYGWKVRKLVENKDETRKAARIQAEAFHEHVALFNNLFFEFFKAEVLSGLMYKLNNSSPDRYACLVDEDATEDADSQKLVGVIDVTVLRDRDVLQHLPAEAQEYLYISGIAVSKTFR